MRGRRLFPERVRRSLTRGDVCAYSLPWRAGYPRRRLSTRMTHKKRSPPAETGGRSTPLIGCGARQPRALAVPAGEAGHLLGLLGWLGRNARSSAAFFPYDVESIESLATITPPCLSIQHIGFWSYSPCAALPAGHSRGRGRARSAIEAEARNAIENAIREQSATQGDFICARCMDDSLLEPDRALPPDRDSFRVLLAGRLRPHECEFFPRPRMAQSFRAIAIYRARTDLPTMRSGKSRRETGASTGRRKCSFT